MRKRIRQFVGVLRPLAVVLFVFAMVSSSQAKPEFLDLFLKHYKPDPSSALASARCGICHDGRPPKKNVYGKALGAELDKSSDGQLTEAMLLAVESQDSDGDKFSNGDEIKQGFLPADPTSHPAGAPKTAPAGTSSAPDEGGLMALLAKEGYLHPAVIHFPIGLYLFGVILEFFGLRKKIDALGIAAAWNFGGALAAMALVAPTGVAAWLLGKHALEGNMLIHLILAVTSLVLMALTIVLRKKLGPSNTGYLVFIVVTALVIGATGHFGGQMVYG